MHAPVTRFIDFDTFVHPVLENIELELRAEVSAAAARKLAARLCTKGKPISRTLRLSVLFFGTIAGREVDLRVRVTNGQAEVVVKKGGYHAADRTEVSQDISSGQFLGMVKLFAELFTNIKVAERETENFDLGNGVTLSLVHAGTIRYIEIEKLTTRARLEKDRRLLTGFAAGLGLKVINSRKAFDKLCRRLTEHVDWEFQPSSRHFQRLERALRQYRG